MNRSTRTRRTAQGRRALLHCILGFVVLTLLGLAGLPRANAAASTTNGLPKELRIGFQKSPVNLPKPIRVKDVFWQPSVQQAKSN